MNEKEMLIAICKRTNTDYAEIFEEGNEMLEIATEDNDMFFIFDENNKVIRIR